MHGAFGQWWERIASGAVSRAQYRLAMVCQGGGVQNAARAASW